MYEVELLVFFFMRISFVKLINSLEILKVSDISLNILSF